MKSVESAVRELTKTVLDLQDKVSSLEKHIIDQNMTIKKLVDDKEVTKLPLPIGAEEGRQPESSMMSTQRPMREARLRAASAITAAGRRAGTGRNVSPLALTTLPPVTATATTSSSRSAPPTPSAPIAPLSQSEVAHDSTAIVIDTGVKGDASNWIEVKPRRLRRPIENVTRGTAVPGSTMLSAAERKSYLHLYFVKPGTTEDQVADYLRSICPDDKCLVEALKPRGDYASFKLSVLTRYVDTYLAPQHWAEDVHIKPWRSGFRKPVQN